MFCKTVIHDFIRVPPELFSMPKEHAVLERVRKDYEGYISQQFGFVIDVTKIIEIKEGTIVPGDGAAYYETTFEMLTFKVDLQDVVYTKVRDIAEFGAFMTIGPTEGMIHISQTMDDYVSFSKDKVLSGKESKRTLNVNDKCRARVVAVSYKDITNPKIGLTMRQPGLGRLDWIEAQFKESKEPKESPKGKKEKK